MAKTAGTDVAALVDRNYLRPLLTHLNADTSWLISLPRPATTSAIDGAKNDETRRATRSYYHILLDPWLVGDITVYRKWVIGLWHTTPPAFTSIDDVYQLIKDIEKAAAGPDSDTTEDDGHTDLLLISTFIEDHCNKSTLLTLPPDTAIITVPSAAKTIRSWNHFTSSAIATLPDLDINDLSSLWRSSTLTSAQSTYLPPWLRIAQIPSDTGYPYLHWATLISFSPDHTPLGTPASAASTILYSPHGIYAHRLTPSIASVFSESNLGGDLLALLHGLDPAWSPTPANLGVDNGWQVAKRIRAKYWIPTHDEHLGYSGIVGWMQSKFKKSFDEVTGRALPAQAEGEMEGEIETTEAMMTVMVEVRNGESFALV